jgi:branched-chain amino acid transport system substrate-binding protein
MATEKWQQDVLSWRTTSSYDATQAFVKAIRSLSEHNQEREDMVQALKSVTLSEKESSGFGLKWSKKQSNDNRPYCMYEVYQGTLRKVEVEVKVKEKEKEK